MNDPNFKLIQSLDTLQSDLSERLNKLFLQLQRKTEPTQQQRVRLDSLPLAENAATEENQRGLLRALAVLQQQLISLTAAQNAVLTELRDKTEPADVQLVQLDQALEIAFPATAATATHQESQLTVLGTIQTTLNALNTAATQISQSTGMLAFVPMGGHQVNGALTDVVTLTIPAGATKLLIQARQADVRYTISETNPIGGTNGTGFILTAGEAPTLIPIRTGTTIKVVQDATGARIQFQWGN